MEKDIYLKEIEKTKKLKGKIWENNIKLAG